jgi:hypothetical protein
VGLVSEQPRTLRDITPTIGELLGFTAEYATGTVLEEILIPEVAVDNAPMNPNGDQLRIRVAGNPASSATRIILTLPAPGDVGVYIHDFSGRILAVPFEGTLGSGDHDLAWHGTDVGTGALGSGVYLLSVTTGYGRAARAVVRLP